MTSVQSAEKPILIYDGECAFCCRWINGWKAITGNAVEYEPYQTAAKKFPSIPAAKFEESVQLIEPGRVSEGAEAVFRALANAPSRRWLLWAYQNVPFARPAADVFYRLVAQNRVFFSILTRLLWGEDLMPSTYYFSRKLFLKALGVIYFIAFVSLGTQIVGLAGTRGILPADEYLALVHHYYSAQRFFLVPTLAWIHPSDFFLKSLCWIGAAGSVLLIVGPPFRLLLFGLWLFYLSLVAVGQDFLSFQWDVLLLEAGLLAVFFAPPFRKWKTRWQSPPALASRELLKWLFFRVMFLSGVVKLASGDPAWRNLTALQYHYYTQPLPPWTAWYAHHLSAGFQKFSVVMMFATELVLPFFLFAPRRLRMGAAFGILFLQVLIFVTGNYCFFNLLVIALALLMLDDSFWPKRTRQTAGKTDAGPRFWPPWVMVPLTVLVLVVTTGQITRAMRVKVPWQGISRQWEKEISPLRSVNSYGLFAVMTTSRLEIQIEGSLDGEVWHEYGFKFKPGPVTVAPEFVQPHQPRLDWQMWFAALGSYRENPWFLDFCGRLLEGSPDVLKLMAGNPFPASPPRYIRAVMYDYQFSDPATKQTTGAWWVKKEKGLYCPVLSMREKNLAAG